MAYVDLTEHMRTHLVDSAIVRMPKIAGPLPPLFLEPRLGVNAPGEGENDIEKNADLVLAAREVTGIAPKRHEGFIRTDAVEFTIRARIPAKAKEMDELLRGALNDRRHWLMGGLLIEESLLFRALTPLRSDSDGWVYLIQFTFERWDALESQS